MFKLLALAGNGNHDLFPTIYIIYYFMLKHLPLAGYGNLELFPMFYIIY